MTTAHSRVDLPPLSKYAPNMKATPSVIDLGNMFSHVTGRNRPQSRSVLELLTKCPHHLENNIFRQGSLATLRRYIFSRRSFWRGNTDHHCPMQLLPHSMSPMTEIL